MKKIITIILCLIPYYSFAFEILPDDSLEEVSGQSGINIFLEGTTKLQVEMGDFTFGDLDGKSGESAGYFGLDGSVDSSRNDTKDKTIFYIELNDTLFKLDVGSSGTGGVIDSDSSNIIVDGTQFVLPNRSYMKIGLPSATEIEVKLELPGKSEIKFQPGTSGDPKFSLGNLVLTPVTVTIHDIYNDLYIASH